MKDAAQVLKAGGLVPANAKLDKDEAVDTVVARAYRHPVLGERVVVRLTSEGVAAGDDLEMAVLGFGGPDDRGAVGKERKRPLGFPGWALVHDAGNARFALDVVKELKKQARKAKSKPGGAKEEIDKIAARLGSTVPHFLPSFYEEVGRIFIEHGSQSYAAAFFGKAREAEAVHALDVDEQHRVDAFLEFALAGAVTTKALAQYAKELGEHHEPAVAYAHFRQLCLQRTLGGMPPWSGMAKELRRLAKAAKLDVDAEARAFVAEIIESPALGKAAGEFWRAYEAPIAELGKRSTPARAAILNLFPTGSGSTAELDDAWLDLVDATGAIDALVGDDPAVAATGGRAAWFDKLCTHLARNWRKSSIGPRAFALLRRLAPKLVADGAPIACVRRGNQVDLDLAELALELGVAVAPVANATFDLSSWATTLAEPDRGRDPVRVAAHGKLGRILASSIADYLGNDAIDAATRGKDGFYAGNRRWLEAQVAQLETKALPAFVEVLAVLAKRAKQELFAELPDLHARLSAVDVAPALARSLRVGILDELGWPALEAAVLEVYPDGADDKDGKPRYTVHGGLPAVIVATATKLIAVGPRARLGEHDLVIPKDKTFHSARFIQGQFLVALSSGWKMHAYWSSAPHDVFDCEGNQYSMQPIARRAAVLADGAWLEAPRPVRAGDRRYPQGGALSSSDGTTAWVAEWRDGKQTNREVSASGDPGRASWPAFVDGYAEEGWELETQSSYVWPAPASVDRSPLGVAGGQLGVRVRMRRGPDRGYVARELETIDGQRWSGLAVYPIELLALPGDDARRLLTVEASYSTGAVTVVTDTTASVCGSKIGPNDRRMWRGSAWAFPTQLWHALVPRDEAGSARLRAITDADARALLDAATDPVLAVLPAITHPRMRRGVAAYVALAAELAAERAKLCSERAPGAVRVVATTAFDEAEVAKTIAPWLPGEHAYGGLASHQIAAMAELCASADRSDRSIPGLGAQLPWGSLAMRAGAVAFLATTIGLPAAPRAALVSLLRVLATLPATHLRSYLAAGDLAVPGHAKDTYFELRVHGGNSFAIRRSGWQGNRWWVLEHAPDGVFRGLPGVTVSQEARGEPLATAEIDALAALAAEPSPRSSWSEDGAERLATATGMTSSEARYLLAGCPNSTNYGSNFLAKELRESLGLKAAQAALARDSLRAIPAPTQLAVLDATGRAGVAALLGGGAADAMATAWNRIVGARVPVSEALIADADRELSAPMKASPALTMIANADAAPELGVDASWAINRSNGNLVRVGQPGGPLVVTDAGAIEGAAFALPNLVAFCSYAPFLFAELPVGDALRAKVAVAYARVKDRLNSPGLLFDGGIWYVDEAARAGAAAIVDSLGGTPHAMDTGYEALDVAGGVVITQRYGQNLEHMRVHLRLRPATLDAGASAGIGKLLANVAGWGQSAWNAIGYVRGDELAAMMARITDTPVPARGWEQNPLASASKLVDRAAKALGVARDAAALYLQYLALLWPTPKNVMMWNGWKSKQFEAANAVLEGKQLVLEAKRERAQRAHFLPGGWEALKSPHPAFETWKLPLYGKRGGNGQVEPLFERYAARAPFHVMFERAWKRIEDGDVPKYDEVKR